jgi:hypothetical protein
VASAYAGLACWLARRIVSAEKRGIASSYAGLVCWLARRIVSAEVRCGQLIRWAFIVRSSYRERRSKVWPAS